MKPSSLTSRLLAGAALLACGFVIGPLLSGCGGGGAFAGTLPQPTSPQGRILFSRDNQLRIINADGTGERPVPNSGSFSFGRLSPDGSKIVSATTVDDNTDVYSFNIDGSNRRRLTTDPALDGSPVWSGDGKKIAFCSGRLLNPSGERNVDIFTMNADGTNQNVLQNTDGNECPSDWSSDNALIASTSTKSNGVTSSIFVTESGGQNDRLLANVGASGVFTRDSQKVIYNTNSELRVVEVTGQGDRRFFTNPDLRGSGPQVSPDGLRVAFYTVINGQQGIYTAKLDGTDIRLVTKEAVSLDWER